MRWSTNLLAASSRVEPVAEARPVLGCTMSLVRTPDPSARRTAFLKKSASSGRSNEYLSVIEKERMQAAIITRQSPRLSAILTGAN
jgi:hypothetical protein